MRILVLSPYPAYSHRSWVEQLAHGFADMEWRVLTLPARHFTWRIRSNPLHWTLTQAVSRDWRPDLILATSMTDLATFQGLFRRELGHVPSIVYFHENQFAYPLTPGVTASIEPRMVNLYSALAADRVVFNSAYNRRTFLAGAEDFLARMPDRLPAGGLSRIADKSEVIPVPVGDTFFDRAVEPAAGGPVRLVWNHRWEYDKGPDRLLAAVARLTTEGVEFRLHLAGQRFKSIPGPMQALQTRFGARIVDHGFLDEAVYPDLLARGGLVLSTAIHDFQGLAILEAAAAGCVPVLPDRLVYPEWFDERYLYPSRDDPEEDGFELAGRIVELAGSSRPPVPNVAAFRLEALAGKYRALLNSMV